MNRIININLTPESKAIVVKAKLAATKRTRGVRLFGANIALKVARKLCPQ
jgi:hypothetical protein